MNRTNKSTFIIIIFLVFILLTILFYTRPIVIEELIITSPDQINILIKEWIGDRRIINSGEITTKDFNVMLESLKTRRYRKYIGNKYYSGDSADYVTYYCINSKEKKWQDITIYKSGSIEVDGQIYDCVDNKDKYLELIYSLHDYMRDAISER